MTRTETLQSFNHYRGDPGALPTWLAEVNATAPTDIQQAARRWLSKPRVVTLTVPAPQQAGAQP